jgi:hypothetical protein
VDGDADAEFELTVDGMPVDRWRLSVAERNFLRLIDLPQGLGGTGPFAALTIVSHSLTPSGRAATAIRQFDIQPASNVIVGFGEGWHEDEFTIDTGAAMDQRAVGAADRGSAASGGGWHIEGRITPEISMRRPMS